MTDPYTYDLMSAIACRDLAWINRAIEGGANLNAHIKIGLRNKETPLTAAIEHNFPEAVRILIERGATTSRSEVSAWAKAIALNRPEAFDVLAKNARMSRGELQGALRAALTSSSPEHWVGQVLSVKRWGRLDLRETCSLLVVLARSIEVESGVRAFHAIIEQVGLRLSGQQHATEKVMCRLAKAMAHPAGAALYDGVGPLLVQHEFPFEQFIDQARKVGCLSAQLEQWGSRMKLAALEAAVPPVVRSTRASRL